ncbi:MAG: bifunctional (p)ppGpp synthetase/guanosine-3',5'-bis(diphosphate) 3'-pyrophosphohydrolase [Patescibacteria group bacterium]
MAEITIKDVISKVKQYLPSVDEGRVMRAYEYAAEAHKGQKRYSGEPYIVHPLNTAYLLTDFRPDENSVVAALLHDVSEDTPRTLEDIEREFGPEVRGLVFGMEKLSKVRSRLDEPQVENLRKLFLVMAKDFRVVMIKLCDRLHNISTLKYVPKEKQRRIAKETLDVYAPIAARLGIYRLKTQLEDYSFEFLEPEIYKDMQKQLSVSFKERKNYISETKKILEKLLIENGIQGTVDGRQKGIYSIYHKMKRKEKESVNDVFDIFAMRITVPNIFKQNKEFVGHVYTALGVIHSNFTPLAQRFKDYIAVPKVNGYRSLHTTVIGLGPDNYQKPTEIQLRTQLMHEQAEYGVAAHWLYDGEGKKGKRDLRSGSSGSLSREAIRWLDGLSRLQEEVTSDEELMKELAVDVFHDRIFVLTPIGDVRDLPAGATPVDFAYAVHTDVGNHCAQAKVNGNIVPLSYQLKSGEVVEIITRKNIQPSQNWLSFVKTSHAKGRISASLRNRGRDSNLRIGKELFNAQLKRMGKSPLDPDLGILRIIDGKKNTLAEREDLLVEVGKGITLPNALLKKVFSLEELVRSTGERKNRRVALQKPAVADDKQVIVGGSTDMPVSFANCCKPMGKNIIVGFVTRGKGISIHVRSCKILHGVDRTRLMAAYWIASDSGKYRVTVRITAKDRIGLIRDVSEVFAKDAINIADFTYEGTRKDGTVCRDITVEIADFDQLDTVLSELEAVPEILSASLSPLVESSKKRPKS